MSIYDPTQEILRRCEIKGLTARERIIKVDKIVTCLTCENKNVVYKDVCVCEKCGTSGRF